MLKPRFEPIVLTKDLPGRASCGGDQGGAGGLTK